MKSLSHPSGMIFLVFLGVYSWQKYTAAAPETFSIGYAINVAILVTLTAILPYVITRFEIAMTKGPVRYILALTSPLILCGAGFATFFFLFIAPSFPQADIMTVLPRSLFPGVTISIILLVPLILHRGNET